jgi:hypothetical protein
VWSALILLFCGVQFGVMRFGGSCRLRRWGGVVRLFCVVCVFFFSPFMLLFCFYALLACLSWGSNVRVVCLNSLARGWNKETS